MRKVAPDAQLIAVTHQWGDYYTRRTRAVLDGSPYVEGLQFSTEPEKDIADNLTIVTVNDKATPAG